MDDRQGKDKSSGELGAGEFVVQELGLFSSHPHFAKRKAALLLRVPVLALVVAAPLLYFVDLKWVWASLQGSSWVTMALLFVSVVGISFTLTACLVIRASCVSPAAMDVIREDAKQGEIPLRSFFVAIGGAALAGMLLFVLPNLLPSAMLPSKLTLLPQLAAVLSFLPFLATLVLFDLFSPGHRRNGSWIRRALILFGLFLILVWLKWKTHWLVALPFVGSGFGELASDFSQKIINVASMVAMIGAVWALGEWTLSGIGIEIAGDDENRHSVAIEKEGAKAVRKPWFARCTAWLLHLFKRTLGKRENQNGATAHTEPDWITDLRSAIPAGVLNPHHGEQGLVFKESELLGGASPISTASEMSSMFGGLQPTEDQEKVVRYFVDVCEKRVDGQKEETVPLDFLIQGENGAGKTTALLGCCATAALARGERVAFFVPDSTARREVFLRISEILRGNGVSCFVQVEELTDNNWLRWLGEQDGRSSQESLSSAFPDVLVSTPEDWENVFFGESCADARQRKMIGEFLLRFTTVLVDDIASAEWSSWQVIHLPFMIDKHRLLLTACQRELQVVATTTLLAHEAIGEVIGRRLFSSDSAPKVHTVRPWQQRLPRRVEAKFTSADAQTASLFDLAVHYLRLGRRTIIYQNIADAAEAERTRQELLTNLTQHWAAKASLFAQEPKAAGEPATNLNPERARVVCHLMERIEGLEQDEERVILFTGTLDEPVARSISSRYANKKTLLIALSTDRLFEPTAVRRSKDRDRGYPILLARTAPALLFAHLRSAAIHFPRLSPIPRNAFSAFGILPAGYVPVMDDTRDRHMGVAVTHCPELRFRLDPPESKVRSSSEDEGGVWPMIGYDGAVEDRRLTAEPVRQNSALQFSARYATLADERTLVFGTDANEREDQRQVRWLDQERRTLAVSDLGLLGELRIRVGDNARWATNVMVDKDRHYHLITEICRNRESEVVFPLWELALRPNRGTLQGQDKDGTRLGVLGPRAGGPRAVKWVRLSRIAISSANEAGGSKPEVANAGSVANEVAEYEMGPPFVATVRIVGGLSHLRQRSMFGNPIEFGYEAAVGVLLLDVTLKEEGQAERIRMMVEKPWKTDRENGFWPELTLALQTGFLACAPRFTQCCRLAAFRLPESEGQGGGAAVFIIEPQGIAGTIQKVIENILDFEEIARQVIGPARVALMEQHYEGPGFADEAALDASAAKVLLEGWDNTPLRPQDIVVMKREELRTELARLLPKAEIGIEADNVYACAGKEWFETQLWPWVSRRMTSAGAVYIKEKHDCDEFAERLRLYVTDQQLFKKDGLEAAHTVFRAFVKIALGKQLNHVPEGNHACNLVRFSDGTWWFVEPQGCLVEGDPAAASMTSLDAALNEGICEVVRVFE
jgi:hypothetical protein